MPRDWQAMSRRVAEEDGWRRTTLGGWTTEQTGVVAEPHQWKRYIWARQNEWRDDPPDYLDWTVIEDFMERHFNRYVYRKNEVRSYEILDSGSMPNPTGRHPDRAKAALLAVYAAKSWEVPMLKQEIVTAEGGDNP